MWLIKLHIAISILCIITFIGFWTVYKETIKNNGWLSEKKKKSISKWLIFFVPIMNIFVLIVLFIMIGTEKSEFDELVKRIDE